MLVWRAWRWGYLERPGSCRSINSPWNPPMSDHPDGAEPPTLVVWLLRVNNPGSFRVVPWGFADSAPATHPRADGLSWRGFWALTGILLWVGAGGFLPPRRMLRASKRGSRHGVCLPCASRVTSRCTRIWSLGKPRRCWNAWSPRCSSPSTAGEGRRGAASNATWSMTCATGPTTPCPIRWLAS